MRLKILRMLPALALLITTGFLPWFWLSPDKKSTDALAGTYDIPRQIRFNYAIRNTSNRVVRNAKFYVYAPVRQTGNQLVTKIESVIPHRVVPDAYGHQLLVFDLPDVPPYGGFELTYASRLKLSAAPIRSHAKPLRTDIGAQSQIEADHPAIQRQAGALKDQTPFITAQNIYQWVADNLAYDGPQGKDRGALKALESRRGDCTDAAFLVAALYRAIGVPARCVGGYVCARDKNVAAREFHNWVEFWIDGCWLVADPVNRCFAEKAETYIATRIWTTEEDGQDTAFWRHRIEGTNLQVRMVG